MGGKGVQTGGYSNNWVRFAIWLQKDQAYMLNGAN